MNKVNTFDGLRFRIQEALAEAKGVPLTAREIAARLHDRDYRNELLDTVEYRVTSAVHALKDKGHIVVTDARDKDGRLTYQLPQRMLFPRRENSPLANPVLSPEIASKITVVEKPDKKQFAFGYAPGILEQIVEVVDTAPYPLTSNEIVDKLRHRYPPDFSDARVKMLFAGSINHLKNQNRLKTRRPQSGRGPGIKYEYYTSKTGDGEAPVKQKKSHPWKGGTRVGYHSGVGDRVIKLVDAASRPLLAREIQELVRKHNIYGDVSDARIQGRTSTLLNNLLSAKRIKARKAPANDYGAKYEYFTDLTGRQSSPLELTERVESKPAAAPAPANWGASKADKVVEVAAVTATANTTRLFRPGVKAPVERRQLNIDITVDEFDRIDAAAKRFGVTKTQLVVDAIDYALAHSE